ncbi:hypothetical protein EDEG_02270 [Edhazardia aedis USNM 41457]|uniref:Uncharacterized protein n=1 Tax=Edhazardia aedis (strain USNM 41457) TaxID=1003232 RepID=J8ZUQ0_EDHAE|nr:hypothetical protein EDEG_02270 [Edhazardia aedis USNM 41457]|eukprot:EJW03413.1 hypothetical protein EDEG_02270 [Edhazardia aedis USNM 41457]
MNPDKFENNILQIKAFWLTISLFYPEIIGFVKLLSNDYHSLCNCESTEILNFSVIRRRLSDTSIFQDLSNKAQDIADTILKSYNQKIKESKKGFCTSLEEFLKNCKLLISYECNYWQYDSFHKIFPSLFELEDKTMRYKNLMFQRNVQNNGMTYAFFQFCSTLPNRILTEANKFYYFKICLLHGMLNIPSKENLLDFFALLKYNCAFELNDKFRKQFEYYIDYTLYDLITPQNPTGNVNNIKNPNYLDVKKNIIQYMRNVIFKFDIENILKNIFKKLELIIGVKACRDESKQLNIHIFLKNQKLQHDKLLKKSGKKEEIAVFTNDLDIINSFTVISKVLCLLQYFNE